MDIAEQKAKEYSEIIHIRKDLRKIAEMNEFIIRSRSALEFCGTPPDGKARRRERRKQERMKRKNK